MKNLEIAQIFSNIAKILEIKNENRFRIRAYDRAAQNLESLSDDIETIAEKDELENIPGIGKDLALKIKEILKTGKLKFYEDLLKETPPGLLDIMSVPSIGPKTAKLLSEKLKITSLEDLEKKARAGKIAGLPGFKAKSIENIMRGVQLIKKGRQRLLLDRALATAAEIISALKAKGPLSKISPAGSLRRMKETIGDIDILVTSPEPANIMKVFTSLPQVSRVISEGKAKSSILTKDKVQVDLLVVDKQNYGAALVYFTGSKNHNIAIRERALKMGYSINEYGIFRLKDKKKVASQTEEDLYKVLGLPYIPPEIREDSGEIEAALKNKLPHLVDIGDIKGLLHVHTEWSDGAGSISEIAQAVQKRGYSYVAICDHSRSVRVAGGLTEEKLAKQIEEIRNLNKKMKNFKILCGTEMDILKDGKLDFSDEMLKELDIVLAAIHSGFKEDEETITKRIISAMENKYVNIIVHPTGRLMGAREPYAVNIEKIIKAARRTNTALEINSYPQRLDLNDIYARKAKQMGVKIAIGVDAHNVSQLDSINMGLAVARRGWLEKKDILNTLPVKELLQKIKK
jgi:DNA polymerase (family X)